jgi:hypothetical protein
VKTALFRAGKPWLIKVHNIQHNQNKPKAIANTDTVKLRVLTMRRRV